MFFNQFRVTGFVDFAIRKRYNIDEAVAFGLSTSFASSGGSVRYVQGFGPKVHTNRRIGSAYVGMGFSRLHSGFGDGGQGGWSGSLNVGANLNSIRYLVDPRTGHSLGLGLSLSGVEKDSGGFGATFSAGSRGNLTIPMGLRNVLVLVGGVGVSVHPVLDADRQALGGRFLLRAFEPDELLGDGRAYAVAEHRYTLLTDQAWNALHLAWIRELQVAAFAGGGLVFNDVRTGSLSSAAEAGLGVRFQFEYGGLQPGVLSLDLAFPLYRQHPYVYNNGDIVRQRQPVGFYLSFDQFF
ncbi:MAG: hypothetical protein IPJ88_13305 [Myxococcales bacterium]|nr:MAG: hypothetical protein IPJ88_13305 [Myxococcales bacterium]